MTTDYNLLKLCASLKSIIFSFTLLLVVRYVYKYIINKCIWSTLFYMCHVASNSNIIRILDYHYFETKTGNHSLNDNVSCQVHIFICFKC